LPSPKKNGIERENRRQGGLKRSKQGRYPWYGIPTHCSWLTPSPIGCLTCRSRRVKCNEERPVCRTCTRFDLCCKWGKHVPLRERRAALAMPRPPKELAPQYPTITNAATFGFGPQDSVSDTGGFVMHPFTPMAAAHETLSAPQSIVLGDLERKALEYYRKEAPFGFGSSSLLWSTHAILLKTAVETAAGHNQALSHLLMATSLTELASCLLPSANNPNPCTSWPAAISGTVEPF